MPLEEEEAAALRQGLDWAVPGGARDFPPADRWEASAAEAWMVLLCPTARIGAGERVTPVEVTGGVG